MSDLPRSILIREDGPREGFQALSKVVSTGDKLRLINALSKTGIQVIEATAFVRSDRIPQLADANEVCAALPSSNTIFHALYLNQRGFTEALTHKRLSVEGFAMLAVSEEFLKRNNNRTIPEALEDLRKFCHLFQTHNIPFDRLMISTVFGDALEGKKNAEDVLALCRRALQIISSEGMTPKEVTFADTTGWGDPEQVKRLISEFRSEFPEIHPGLHLHDTRGTGMANAYAGLLSGVTRFDCSVAGMGGCPFAPGAAGNIPTEDFAFLAEELGVSTGLNLEKYIECAHLAQEIAGRPLPGKLKDSGLLRVLR